MLVQTPSRRECDHLVALMRCALLLHSALGGDDDDDDDDDRFLARRPCLLCFWVRHMTVCVHGLKGCPIPIHSELGWYTLSAHMIAFALLHSSTIMHISPHIKQSIPDI